MTLNLKTTSSLIFIFALMLKRILYTLLFVLSSLAITPEAKAQCSMCTISAEQGTKNGNTQGKGLNDGIIYLLVIPYLLIAGIGFLWYKNYRKKTIDTLPHQQLN